MFALQRRKTISPLLLLVCLLTIINVHLASLDAHDADTERIVGGIVAIIGGAAAAASVAGDFDPFGFAAGVGAMGFGLYLLTGGDSGSCSGSNDPTDGTESLQPPVEYDSYGQTMYN
ncbi:hypothetical protein F4Y59_00870 [Candidatus Poribacteria bacterium]|nr:hypothetical protein [Candidatus Poribacteria bacterium]MYK19599.1 hypothetical protein [Candidatus Poribacteria bacterium]